jgi:hypothetical protein
MKAYDIDRFGSVGGIVRRSSEDPRPGPKEVLMRVPAGRLSQPHARPARDGGKNASHSSASPPRRLETFSLSFCEDPQPG